MVSGVQKHSFSHRPMWPEYEVKPNSYKVLYILIGRNVIDENGVAERVESWEDLASFMHRENALVFVQSLTVEYHFPFLFEAVADKNSKVLCNRHGSPLAVRVLRRGRTAWVVRSVVWDGDATTDFLVNMRKFFAHVGVGTANTPSSLGHLLMKLIHQQAGYSTHTALSIYCEDFIREHSVGGIVQCLAAIGSEYDEGLLLDKGGAWLSYWTVHPDTAGVIFKNGHCDHYETWFARCTVTIHSDLPLGPFPLRRGKKSKVYYPTLKGTYEDVYLWREQAMACELAGCTVQVHNGYGWRKFTDNQVQWAKYAYGLRKTASTTFIAERCKGLAVGGMGHHSMSRDRYYLVPEDRAPHDAVALPDENGFPLRLFRIKEVDTTSAIMVHWSNYTQSMCNLDVYLFGLPFAREGRLLQMDYDSVLVLEQDERHRYISRLEARNHDLEPGTWLWELLHNIEIKGERAFKSREKNKLPGVINDKKSTRRV